MILELFSTGLKQSLFDAGKRLPIVYGVVQRKQKKIRVRGLNLSDR